MPRMLPEEADRLLSNVPEQFTFHVNDQKNDFANWIADVIGDRSLARELWQTKNPATTMQRLADRVAFLESRRG